LARNNTDWYTLLDLATVVGTLMADTEGVYDPRQYNDRILLANPAISFYCTIVKFLVESTKINNTT